MVNNPMASQSVILNGSRTIGYCDTSLFFSSSLVAIDLTIDTDVGRDYNERDVNSYCLGNRDQILILSKALSCLVGGKIEIISFVKMLRDAISFCYREI